MYKKLIQKINALRQNNSVQSFLIGTSSLGCPIWAFHVGSYSGKQLLLDAAIHAREYISSFFLLNEIDYLINQNYADFGFYFIPLCNPDGVRLCLEGRSWITDKLLKNVLFEANNRQEDFSLWKANALLTDINVNFDASWGGGEQNVTFLSSANFIGFYPASAKETQILSSFASKIKFDAHLSFHTKGEVIYYGFYKLTKDEIKRDYNIAKIISNQNGYEIIKTEKSTGGFTDWVSQNFHVPSFTIELGDDTLTHPIKQDQLQKIFIQNKNVPEKILEHIKNINN